MATATVAGRQGDPAMSRQQIGIDRLPIRRPADESKEAMNCKSCRKRKIKCNRIKPQCEACKVFDCACVYDAIPRKRGPKTDVLEALLKRVNGLEKRLKDENKLVSAAEVSEMANSVKEVQDMRGADGGEEAAADPTTSDSHQEVMHATNHAMPPALAMEPSPAPALMPMLPLRTGVMTDVLFDTHFTRVHGRPYYVLDEAAARQKLRDGEMPRYLLHAIYALSARHVPHLYGTHEGAVQASLNYAVQARLEIDVDEPTIEHLQALLLLAMAAYQAGKGRKSYMLLTHAITMVFALSLHRELPASLRIAPSERESRRKLFWTCYLADHFMVTGSKRPSLITDESIYLRLPGWQPPGSHMTIEGNYFRSESSMSRAMGVASARQGSGATVMEIIRVLGLANRYLAAGGVKGDSHFPWHVQSTLSRIRSELDFWAASTNDAFASMDALFNQPDSSCLVLSKLIYHLIHCLVYRPFLPVDLAELQGAGQYQSWSLEAMQMCFLHANAIAELVEIGKGTMLVDWPSFVGYCICTAGTVHVHGAHYMSYRRGDVFSNSAEFLSRAVAQLSDVRLIWGGSYNQYETIKSVCASHSQLVKSLASNPVRFSPVFQMEDFFDRYPGLQIDGAYVSFSNPGSEGEASGGSLSQGIIERHKAWVQQPAQDLHAGYLPALPIHSMTRNQMSPTGRISKKRRTRGSISQINDSSAIEQTSDTYLPRQEPHDGWTALSYQQQSQPAGLMHQQHEPQITGYHQRNQDQSHDLPQPPALAQNPFSPNFSFSPMEQPLPAPLIENGFDESFYGFEQHTPSDFGSISAGSSHTDPEKDPFLTLLEQMAQTAGSPEGGLSELDFYLNGQG